MTRELSATAEHWARITSIGPDVGPMVSLGLEIHLDGCPPFGVSTVQWLPRDVVPEVGQDVDFSVNNHDGHTAYFVEWSRPPRYGDLRERDALNDERRRAMTPPRTPAERRERLHMADDWLRRGLITPAQHEQFQRRLGGVDQP